jgi:hypothetical protein
MAEPKKPFYVSFSHDAIDVKVDHSRAYPGPPGGPADRAGYTKVTSKPRFTIAWDNAPLGRDGRLPIFARSANVYFRLIDYVVAITSDFAERSCAYKATLRHEVDAHIYDPIRIFHSYRDVLIGRLNLIAVPTETAPLRVASTAEATTRQEAIERTIVQAINETRQDIVRDLKAAKARHDAPDSYGLVYNQCTAKEWASGR